MASITEWIAPIAACGFIGAFIDFYIGKSGQATVKKKLEDWWLKVSYFDWKSLGREEALFAAWAIELLFGKTFSRQRLLILVIIFMIAALLSVYVPLFTANGIVFFLRRQSIFRDNINILIVLMIFSFSITLTVIAARSIATILYNRPYLNIIGVFALLLFQYFVFCYSQALLLAIQTILPTVFMFAESNNRTADLPAFRHLLSSNISDLSSWFSPEQLNPFVSIERIKIASSFSFSDISYTNGFKFQLLMSVIVNAGRLMILGIFFMSYSLLPVRESAMIIWARIIESEKPTFTLVFGGVAASIKALQEAFKAL